MIAPRWKKILRDLWLNKTRSLLVVLSIGVGVFAVGVVTQTFTIVGNELTVAYPQANPASATLYPDYFDDDLVEMVRRIPGIADAEGRTATNGQIQLDGENQRLFTVFGIADFDDMRISKIRPQGAYDPAPSFHGERGHWSPADHEIILERSSLLVPGLVPPGLQVGDTITIVFNDRPRELTVAGLAYAPTEYPAPFANGAYGFVSMDTYEWLVGSNQYDMLLITVSENNLDQTHINDVANTVKKKIESGGRTVYFTQVPQPGKHPIQDYFAGMLLLLNLLSYGSLLLSGFLVVNIINALLAQQIRQIGIMKALGARTGQMVVMYLGMVIFLGLLALIAAIPLASLVAGQTTQYLAGLANVDFANTGVPTELLILEIMIGIAVPLLAALLPIIGGMRITVREALSNYGMGKIQSRIGCSDRWLDRIRGVSRPTLISFRNTFRRKSRLALTLTTLILAGTIFISVTSVHSSMLLSLDDAWKSWNWDVLVRFERAYRTDLVEPIAQSVPGVDFVESWGGAAARYVRADQSESGIIQLFAPPPKTQLMIPNVVEGRWLFPDDDNAIVLGMDVLKVEKDIRVGDEIKLKFEGYGKESTWIVVGKVQTVGSFGGIGVAYVNFPHFATVTGQMGRVWQVEIATQGHTAADQQNVLDALLTAYKEQGIQINANSYTKNFLRQNSEFFFTIITALLMAMAVLMAFVGGLGLMGTMSINVLERTREIGVMRAIGATNGAVRGVVMSEGVFIGVLSGLISAVLSYPLAQAVSGLVGEAIFQLPLSFAFSLSGTCMWLAIVTLLSALASFLPAFNASRLTVREVLAYE